MNAISKTSLEDDIWKNFRTIAKTVTTTTITGSSTPITIQDYFNAFPNELLMKKEDYPIIIINSPRLPTSQFTIGKDRVSGTLMIEIYGTQAEAVSKFSSQIISAVEMNRAAFRAVGLYPIHVLSNDMGHIPRGQIGVHYRRINFSFKFIFPRSDA